MSSQDFEEAGHKLDPGQEMEICYALPWRVMGYVLLTEEDTNSSSRTFLNFLFQELLGELGIRLLKERITDPRVEDLIPEKDAVAYHAAAESASESESESSSSETERDRRQRRRRRMIRRRRD
ncbi:hypothetical protein Patl1_11583 [Pistacia atlantica]|uniref:Uncharacterized protein n=1 Tax=Pistacia atlantica TaxID=434234 RepID=A0ACC1A254_9ROSI|nr:hypothetical protein Patl1_11583 [Pistacia atlantica]